MALLILALLQRIFLKIGRAVQQMPRPISYAVFCLKKKKHKWQLEASYTYSVARGDAESYRSQIGNDPALAEAEPGFLDYDQRHVIKLNAVAFLPGDWRLGGTATWASGLPYSATTVYSDDDD